MSGDPGPGLVWWVGLFVTRVLPEGKEVMLQTSFNDMTVNW